MPQPIPVPLRRALWRRFQQGQSPATIAAALGLSVRTVRHLLRRLPVLEGLRPACRAGPGRPAADPGLLDELLRLRQQLPRAGAGFLRVRLAQAHPGQALPSERTLLRWLARHGQAPAPAGRRPRAPTPPRAEPPHQRWQVDAAEQMRLATGAGVCWLRLVDECSGAFLRTVVFPPVLLGPG